MTESWRKMHWHLFPNLLLFSTSDSSDVLLLSKVRDLEIFGSGPVHSRERTPCDWLRQITWGVCSREGSALMRGPGVPSYEGSGGPLICSLFWGCHWLRQITWGSACVRGLGVCSFKSHVIYLNQSEGPLTWVDPQTPHKSRPLIRLMLDLREVGCIFHTIMGWFGDPLLWGVQGSAHMRGLGVRSCEGSGGPLTLFVERSDVP